MGAARLKTKTLPAPIGGLNTASAAGALPPSDLIYSWNLLHSEMGIRARNGYREWCTGLTGTTSSVWAATTAYLIGAVVTNGGVAYVCTTAGTSAGAGGPTGDGAGIVDGTVVWDYYTGDKLVRSVIPFTGGRKNGATNKLFATTASGLWDVTSSTNAPTRSFTFPTRSGEAGYCTSTTVSTPAGRFLLVCDEENGAIVYSEAATTSLALRYGATVPWAINTAYTVGNLVTNGANAYICTVAGTSAGAGGPVGQGIGIVDNTATWKFYEGAWTPATLYTAGCFVTNGAGPKRIYVCTTTGISAGAGGPAGTGTGIVDNAAVWSYVVDYSLPVGMSLSDQQLGLTGTPDRFVQAVVWKSRVWFTEKDGSRAWYLPVNSIYGTATSFDFGVRMQSGGALVGLYNWSYDAGNGIDALLVGISSSGDVVIYQGTDPSSVSTFGLKGTWSVGAVPYGRRIATDFGGDLLVMSLLGLVPLSRLVVGQPVLAGDRSVYATEKVSNFFQLAATSNRLLQGWQVLLHPAEGGLMVLLPTAAGANCNPLMMVSASRSWWPYRDLPIYSAQSWQGELYFGTTDGRLCWSTGYVDAVLLADPNSYSPVKFSGLSGYSNLGNARNKRVQLIRPTLLAQSSLTAIQATARYRFDTTEPPPPGAAASGRAGNVWDTAIWDGSVWGGDYSPLDAFSGGSGVGRDVAIAFRGSAVSRTVLVSVDVLYEEGGLL